MNYQRPHLQLLKARVSEKRKFIQVMIGPRQVGKTTLLTQFLSKLKQPHHFAAADAVANSNSVWIKQQWETARLKLKQEGADELLLVIDEIQKIDNWSEVVKQLWDEDTRNKRNIKIILSGSSRLLLQQGLTESMAGRFETMYVGHWSFKEMQKAFDWDENKFAWFGGYPGSVMLADDEPRWKNYVAHALIETSISKDIFMLTRVDKPALMKRLFEFGCDYSGQILSYNKMLGQLLDAGNTTTLSHYLELLNTAGLLCGLEKFSQDKIRQRASSPKFMVHNTALISAQRQETMRQMLAKPDSWGRVAECAVGAHLLNSSLSENFELSYWRDGNHEMDFVIKRGNYVIAIEVKSGKKNLASGAAAFAKKFPRTKMLVIENSGISWKDFLKMNPAGLF